MARRTTEPDQAQLAAAQLTARVDQALAVADQAMRTHTGNRELVDTCLDVVNALRPKDPR